MINPFSHLTCKVNGVELHYLTAGKGPLLLLLHGFPEYSGIWSEYLQELSDTYTVVAPDLRGYNLSSQPSPIEQYAVPLLVQDINQLIQTLSPDGEAYVVGHDWGGIIAWYLADYVPAVVKRLVVLSAPHPALFQALLATDSEQQKRSAYMSELMQTGSEQSLAADDFKALRVAVFGAKAAEVISPDQLGHLECWRRGLRGAVNYYRDYIVHQGVYIVAMRGVSVPTLVLWGDADHAFSVHVLDGLEEHVADCKVIRFPKAGHWLARDCAAAVKRELRLFLPATGRSEPLLRAT